MELKNYLLLDYLSDYPASLSEIMSDDSAEYFNKAPLLMSLDETVKRLKNLQELGYIMVTEREMSIEGQCLRITYYNLTRAGANKLGTGIR